MDEAATNEFRVVATAGHVDHGKSSLIVRLTGMDPDRLEEEKRRGLTIDLGYAWCTLPSGREIGFVDVPGHERFIANMLAGVGPVRAVLFVVAADEGWKPQSEEHLQILDVLGTAAGVVALTKRDLVDDETLAIATDEVRERLAGTCLHVAPIVAVSSATGEGMDELAGALDMMLAEAPPPEPARTRLHVDRVFTIKGAGTVVTGTLTGGCFRAGDEVMIHPSQRRARIRSLQTHRAVTERACPVSRVAVNLVGAEREQLQRGDVLAIPGEWRPTDRFDGVLRPVRGTGHDPSMRGAYKVYTGAAEVDATVRVYGPSTPTQDEGTLVGIRTSEALTLDVFDRFILREAGRRETVAGGEVLDVDPPLRAGAGVLARLNARRAASRAELPELLANERGAISADDARLVTGSRAPGGVVVEGWLVGRELHEAIGRGVMSRLGDHHAAQPLAEGADVGLGRAAVSDRLRSVRVAPDLDLVDLLLRDMAERGDVVVTGTTMKLPMHGVALDEHDEDLARLLEAVGGERIVTPPTITELTSSGLSRAFIEAAARGGVLVQVSSELVFTQAAIERGGDILRAATDGITVSAFRESLGTSRKFAVPLLEYFDRTGVTRRDGDLRFPR